jgi:hypothetical protein
MQWAWEVDAPAKPKFLLTALAWMCQDGDPQKSGNVCWPRLETLMQRCGIRSKRSLYDHLSWLESKNLLWREILDGRTHYFLNFGGIKPPAAQPDVIETPTSAPVRDFAQAAFELPDASAKNCGTSAKTRSDSIDEKKGKKISSQKTSPSESQKKVQPAVAHRLPDDWTPGEVGRLFAEALGLDAQATFDQFRDYWTAHAGASARKLDWLAAWRVWCRREGENHRNQRRGQQASRDNLIFSGFIDEDELAAAEARLKAKGLWDRVPQPGYGAVP